MELNKPIKHLPCLSGPSKHPSSPAKHLPGLADPIKQLSSPLRCQAQLSLMGPNQAHAIYPNLAPTLTAQDSNPPPCFHMHWFGFPSLSSGILGSKILRGNYPIDSSVRSIVQISQHHFPGMTLLSWYLLHPMYQILQSRQRIHIISSYFILHFYGPDSVFSFLMFNSRFSIKRVRWGLVLC